MLGGAEGGSTNIWKIPYVFCIYLLFESLSQYLQPEMKLSSSWSSLSLDYVTFKTFTIHRGQSWKRYCLQLFCLQNFEKFGMVEVVVASRSSICFWGIPTNTWWKFPYSEFWKVFGGGGKVLLTICDKQSSFSLILTTQNIPTNTSRVVKLIYC